MRYWRDLAFCLGQLKLNEKVVKKLVDHVDSYKHALADATVAARFGALARKARKGARPELKDALLEWQNKLAQYAGTPAEAGDDDADGGAADAADAADATATDDATGWAADGAAATRSRSRGPTQGRAQTQARRPREEEGGGGGGGQPERRERPRTRTARTRTRTSRRRARQIEGGRRESRAAHAGVAPHGDRDVRRSAEGARTAT